LSVAPIGTGDEIDGGAADRRVIIVWRVGVAAGSIGVDSRVG